jgi:hypothetical protein
MADKLSLEMDTSKIKAAILEYDKLISFEDKITGSKEIKKTAAKIRTMFFNLYNSIGEIRKKRLAEELKDVKNIIINKKITFLKYVFEKSNPPRIVFDSDKYGGSYEKSYSDLCQEFNENISKYYKFKFTEQDPNKKQNINFIVIKEINEKNMLFISIIDITSQILNLVSTPEVDEQYSRDSSRGMRIDKDIQGESNSGITHKRAILIQENGNKYKKIEFVKSNKFSILKEVLKSNEIK